MSPRAEPHHRICLNRVASPRAGSIAAAAVTAAWSAILSRSSPLRPSDGDDAPFVRRRSRAASRVRRRSGPAVPTHRRSHITSYHRLLSLKMLDAET